MKKTSKGIFIVGTDTGVGKTYIACSLANALNKRKISLAVMKPIASGDRKDAESLIRASGSKEKINSVNPIFLKYPLAPYVSAKLEKKSVNLKKVWAQFKKLGNKYDFLIVEGIGGLMAPIKSDYFVIDMIRKFNLPALVVARPSLGTLNHTLLTVEKLRREKIKIIGIVLSGGRKLSLAEKTNPTILKELTGLPVTEVYKNKELNLGKNPWLIK